MKIVFFGDSITDAGRDRSCDNENASFGYGYPYIVNAYLTGKHPNEYEIINRGISSNRVVDLYARVKTDVWNLKPDMLSILVGINDVWYDNNRAGGADLVGFEKLYRMLIEDTLKVLPNLKIVILEPFVLKVPLAEGAIDEFRGTKEYAEVVKKIAEDYNCLFVSLQKDFDAAAKKYGMEYCLKDGVHPAVGGAYLIADKWLKTVLGESL